MGYIGRDLRTGAFRQLDDISSGFDGSDTTHTMQVNSTNVSVGDVNQILLSLGGVIQKPGTDFTVSGSTLTFTTAPASGLSFFAILLGSDNGGTVTPTDGSVTGDKLASTVTTSSNITTTGTTSLDGAVTINESSADVDFRVESNGNANMLFVDGGNDVVGIGTSSPATDAGLTISSSDTGTAIFLERSGSGKFDSAIQNNGGSLLFKGGSNQTTVGSLTEFMRIDSVGHVTMPLQPAVQVHKTGTQSNMSNNDTITFDTEIFDQNADFASNTFTAPVTGKYLITLCVSVTGLDYDATYNRVKLITSNRNKSFGIRGEQTWTANPNYHSFEGSLLCDMDANDTAYIVWSQAGGVDAADAFDSTFASFHLVC